MSSIERMIDKRIEQLEMVLNGISGEENEGEKNELENIIDNMKFNRLLHIESHKIMRASNMAGEIHARVNALQNFCEREELVSDVDLKIMKVDAAYYDSLSCKLDDVARE